VNFAPLTLPTSAREPPIGLFHAEDFRLTTGTCADCATIPQALWYFADETIAVPRAGLPVAGFTHGIEPHQDVLRWAAAQVPGASSALPPLVWLAAPMVLRGARLSSGGQRVESAGRSWSFSVVPKIPLNRSYYDNVSIAFLAQRPLMLRGTTRDGNFTARVIWPEDFRLDFAAAAQPIEPNATALHSLVRAEPRGGAQSPFAAMTLWERTRGAARTWENAPVLAAILNGAQGDDDEAHGGHFALITGRVGTDGAIGDWLTNNFYTLDSFSEKGIIAAMTPLDNYLGDLNSGQAWYRPSYLIVAILKNERIASHIQGALGRVYNQFYRHQLRYDHATMNCASISIDVLRALGWRIRARGPSSHLLAAVGLPYFAIRNRSIAKAEQMYDYLTEDRTRLFPAVAFEEIGSDLLQFATGQASHPLSSFEAMLAEDLDALVFLRVPQLPSSRAWGDYPVVSWREYSARVPADPSLKQIIPVPERPFPENLRDPDLLPPPRRASARAVAIWALLSVIGIPWLAWRWWRNRTKGRPNS